MKQLIEFDMSVDVPHASKKKGRACAPRNQEGLMAKRKRKRFTEGECKMESLRGALDRRRFVVSLCSHSHTTPFAVFGKGQFQS